MTNPTNRSTTMPQYPHRPIVQALDRLTEQARRIAELLTAGAQQDSYALAPPPADDTTALDRVIEVIATYEDMCLSGYTACQPLDVVRQLRTAVNGEPMPPGWEPGKPTP